MLEKNSQKRSGFTLIENIIAFTILTITILAASNLLSSSIKQSQENTLRLQAYLLAEQGIEASRNIRDSQWMQNISFDNTQTELWGGNSFYPKSDSQEIAINPIYNSLNTVTGRPFEILSGTKSQLYLDNSLGFARYTHTPNSTPSPFKRTITVSKQFQDLNKLAKLNQAQNNFDSQQNIEDNILLIKSVVEYEFRGKTKTVELQELLSDWKEGPL